MTIYRCSSFVVILLFALLVPTFGQEEFPDLDDFFPEGDLDSLFSFGEEESSVDWWESKLDLSVDVTGNFLRDRGVTKDNRIELRDAETSAEFNWRFSVLPPVRWFSMTGVLAGEIDNSLTGLARPPSDGDAVDANTVVELSPDYAYYTLGFSQLYMKFSPEPIGIILGRYPLSIGSSYIVAPTDYTRTTGSFWEEEGIWVAGVDARIGPVTLRANYLPFWEWGETQLSNRRDEMEHLLYWLESGVEEHVVNLDVGLFIDPVTLHLLGYVGFPEEETPYASGGGTLEVSAGNYFRFYGEALYGSGFNGPRRLVESDQKVIPPNTPGVPPDGLPHPAKYIWEEYDRTTMDYRFAVGAIYAPTGNIDITLEYYLNGPGLSSDQLDDYTSAVEDYNDYGELDPRQIEFASTTLQNGMPFRGFELSKHYTNLLVVWRNIDPAEKLSITSLSTATFPKFSFFEQLKIGWEFTDHLELTLGCELYLGDEGTPFGIHPTISKISSELSWTY